MFQSKTANPTPIVNKVLSTAAGTMILAGVFASVTSLADVNFLPRLANDAATTVFVSEAVDLQRDTLTIASR